MGKPIERAMDRIIKVKTKEVIENNLETVQKIAYLLGENASETQVVLDSIIHSFSADLSDKEKNGTT